MLAERRTGRAGGSWFQHDCVQVCLQFGSTPLSLLANPQIRPGGSGGLRTDICGRLCGFRESYVARIQQEWDAQWKRIYAADWSGVWCR